VDGINILAKVLDACFQGRECSTTLMPAWFKDSGTTSNLLAASEALK